MPPKARQATDSTKALTDGAAWAATRQFGKRICETCRWGARNPDALRFINDALRAKRDQGATFTYGDLAAEAHRRFGYPLKDGAIRLHYRRGCM